MARLFFSYSNEPVQNVIYRWSIIISATEQLFVLPNSHIMHNARTSEIIEKSPHLLKKWNQWMNNAEMLSKKCYCAPKWPSPHGRFSKLSLFKFTLTIHRFEFIEVIDRLDSIRLLCEIYVKSSADYIIYDNLPPFEITAIISRQQNKLIRNRNKTRV